MKRSKLLSADLDVPLKPSTSKPQPAKSVKFKPKGPVKSQNSTINESNPAQSSLNSMSASSNYFNENKPAKLERSRNYTESLQKLKSLERKVKKSADQCIREANKIADMTQNKKADYHDLERNQPEFQLLDHFRFLNDRILQGEEEEVRMSCTPEMVDGIYRRYLPSTIDRRNGITVDDLQQAYLGDQVDKCLGEAMRVLIDTRNKQNQSAESDFQKFNNKGK
ncbi:hypothetical protein SS50377_28302 [Spironucleus salmonicida]|uniref:Uncharacterized protein n=1 Tax=Spironucleus salmonicida TaxID=348837 RepID=V6LRA5_9EUKA|nr:hypothetical protein SS50377_28302 [Spironucleus salmonicida]|eukprot:EST46783.1 hypothetical protein SS50377_13183 [Spironucleus salmonicida]